MFSFLRFLDERKTFLWNGTARSFDQTPHDVIKVKDLHSREIPLPILRSKRALGYGTLPLLFL